MSAERYGRQTFLGDNAQRSIEQCRVGIAGLGGGGSHIVQQLAHIGFLDYAIFDHDFVEESNLNRMVGATEADATAGTSKVDVARRVILGLQPGATIRDHMSRWQDAPEDLRRCDLIFGCVDTFSERRELEICSRRYLIPYIDIGMDVNMGTDGQPVMGGQVIVSLPGRPCMLCMGFLTPARLAQEAALYGAAGGRPQVVWPNGVLASTAVGLALELVTGWTKRTPSFVYLTYRGNTGTMEPHPRAAYVPEECYHYSMLDVGDPNYVDL